MDRLLGAAHNTGRRETAGLFSTAMQQVLRGTLVPLLQRATIRFNPETGWSADSNFASFSAAQIQYLYSQYAAVGCEVEMSQQGGRHELMVKDTRGNITIDRWECGVDIEQPNILQNPFLDVSQADRDILATAAERQLRLSEAVEYLNNDPDVTDTYVDVTNPVTLRIWREMRKGATQYETGKLVLIHTTSVSNRYASNVSEANEYCRYTHSQLLSEVLSPSSWVFPLPGRLQYKITSFYNRNMPTPRDYFMWSWLKSISPERCVSGMRVEIETRYKLDQWPTDRYAQAS